MKDRVYIPKGNNRAQAEKYLMQNGWDVPNPKPRQLFVSTAQAEYFWCKDTDIPGYVLELGGLGFAGTDVLGEIEASKRRKITGKKVGTIVSADGYELFFTALAPIQTADNIEKVLATGNRHLNVGTSYPQSAATAMGEKGTITRTCRGGAEVLPFIDPDVDVLFELFQTGKSALVNRLRPLSNEDGTLMWKIPVDLVAFTSLSSLKDIQNRLVTAAA